MALTEVVASVVAMFFVDRLGRRVLLLVSGAALAVCTGVMGGYFYAKVRLRMRSVVGRTGTGTSLTDQARPLQMKVKRIGRRRRFYPVSKERK